MRKEKTINTQVESISEPPVLEIPPIAPSIQLEPDLCHQLQLRDNSGRMEKGLAATPNSVLRQSGGERERV